MLQYDTKRRSALFAQGKCMGCAKPNKKRLGKVYCAKCAAVNASRLRKMRANYKAKGLCYACGKPAIPGRTLCPKHKIKSSEASIAHRDRSKQAVFNHYGKACKCCGETIVQFLTADHKKGGGNAHRATERMAHHNIWRWLVLNGFPKEFQILCFNCNQATSGGRKCPHKSGR